MITMLQTWFMTARRRISTIYKHGCAGKKRMISISAGYAERENREKEMKDRYVGLGLSG